MKWKLIQNELNSFRSDILVILDTCCAGDACRSASRSNLKQHRMELLAACTSDKLVIGPSAFSFTRSLEKIITRLSKSSKTFSVANVYTELKIRYEDFEEAFERNWGHKRNDLPRPVYKRLRGNGPSIQFQKRPATVDNFIFCDDKILKQIEEGREEGEEEKAAVAEREESLLEIDRTVRFLH